MGTCRQQREHTSHLNCHALAQDSPGHTHCCCCCCCLHVVVGSRSLQHSRGRESRHRAANSIWRNWSQPCTCVRCSCCCWEVCSACFLLPVRPPPEHKHTHCAQLRPHVQVLGPHDACPFVICTPPLLLLTCLCALRASRYDSKVSRGMGPMGRTTCWPVCASETRGMACGWPCFPQQLLELGAGVACAAPAHSVP